MNFVSPRLPMICLWSTYELVGGVYALILLMQTTITYSTYVLLIVLIQTHLTYTTYFTYVLLMIYLWILYHPDYLWFAYDLLMN